MNRLRALWLELGASLWFVPTVIVVASMAGAVVLVDVDSRLALELAQQWPRVFGASAEGSRAMLSAIATSMVTVAGVTFSITIVALSMAATQYSPRILRNFMRDRPTQAVLGVFVGIFAYCLVVLRTIRGTDANEFVPSLAVIGGMAYAFAGIGFLIFFIHHVALSIQASSILERIFGDTAGAIDHLFLEKLGEPPPGGEVPAPRLPQHWNPVFAQRHGYVTHVDSAAAMRFATERDCVLRLTTTVGAFVREGGLLLEASGDEALDAEACRQLRALVLIGAQRTVEQDAAFGLQQLVDVAVKALSPGINDPTTACMCLDHLGALLARLAGRRIPDPQRMLDGRLRVIAPGPGFADLLALAFEPALHYADDAVVHGRNRHALDAVASAAPDPPRRAQVDAMSWKVERSRLALAPRRPTDSRRLR
jgi:uncharacterized membrane protein